MLQQATTVIGGIVIAATVIAAMMFTGAAFPWPQRKPAIADWTGQEIILAAIEAVFFPIPWLIWGMGWVGALIIAVAVYIFKWMAELGQRLPNLSEAIEVALNGGDSDE